MNSNPPLPERALPPLSADRIRAAIMVEEPKTSGRWSSRTWLLPIAAVLVVIALLATAVVLWPRTPETQVVARPSASPTSAPAEPTPMPTELPSPTPRPSSSVPLEPGPKQEPFDTDRRALKSSTASALLKECHDMEEVSGQQVLYARRVSDGQKAQNVVIYRDTEDLEWVCAPASVHVPLDKVKPDVGPNSSFPVVADAGWTQRTDGQGVGVEWTYRARSTVDRIQVRAVVGNQPTRWFEAKVDGGFAYLPILTPGKFKSPKNFRLVLDYQHRAFDKDGREVPFA